VLDVCDSRFQIDVAHDSLPTWLSNVAYIETDEIPYLLSRIIKHKDTMAARRGDAAPLRSQAGHRVDP